MANPTPPTPGSGSRLVTFLACAAVAAAAWWHGHTTAPPPAPAAAPLAVRVDGPVALAPPPPLPPAPVPVPPDLDAAVRGAAREYLRLPVSEFQTLASHTGAGQRLPDAEAALAVLRDARKAALNDAVKALMRPFVAADGSYPDPAAASAAFRKASDSILAGLRDAAQ